MYHLDAILRSEHEAARLLFEVNGAAQDEAVFERAEAYKYPLLACIKREIAVPLGRLETIEDSLAARMEAFAHKSGSDPADRMIDMVVAAEQVMSQGMAERIERRLFDRIATAKDENRPQRIVWPLVTVFHALFSTRIARPVSIGVMALAVLAGVMVGRFANSDSDLLTLITRAYGTAYRDDLVVSVENGATLSCTSDGSLTLVNKAGTVSIHNEIALTVEKASERSVVYSLPPVSSAETNVAGGKVEFAVAKRTKRQTFVVETPYFDIHVVGTRFVVSRERGDGFSAAVLEGSVRITSRLFGDTVLSTGQVLSLTPDRGGVRIVSADAYGEMGNALISNSPERAECRLQVFSTPAYAAVLINESPAGVTPFAAVVPSGTYAVSVRLNGCRAVDTVVELRSAPLDLNVTLAPDSDPAKQKDLVSSAPDRRDLSSGSRKAAALEKAKKTLGDAQRLESGDWKKAVVLYRQLASSIDAPPLYRETALFSLGRLSADRQRDTAGAMGDFSRYLILYPRGLFAGEALLRLSELELTRNPRNAVDYFRKFLTTSPDHPRRADAAYRFGLLLQQHNEYAEAIRLFTIAIEETKGNRLQRQNEIRRMIAEAESLIETKRMKSATR
jgi:tetratricopeptide (TPR) repeat protein